MLEETVALISDLKVVLTQWSLMSAFRTAALIDSEPLVSPADGVVRRVPHSRVNIDLSH